MEDDVLARAAMAGDGGDDEGWRPDPARPGHERFWDGYEWTDQVRPDGFGARRARLPEVQRALAAATADIDSVEDRLSALFDRTGGGDRPRTRLRDLAVVPDESGQLGVNSAVSLGRNADDNWDGLDDGDVIVLADFYEDPEEFEDVEVHRAADELDDDDVLSDVDAALLAEVPEEF